MPSSDELKDGYFVKIAKEILGNKKKKKLTVITTFLFAGYLSEGRNDDKAWWRETIGYSEEAIGS